MKRLDTLNDLIAKIYTLLLHLVDGKCSCFLTKPSDRVSSFPDPVVHDPTERKSRFIDNHIPMPEEEELMTITETIIYLNICRSTLDKLRNEGRLTTLKQNRSVRLLKSEVEEARGWYSLRKGKV